MLIRLSLFADVAAFRHYCRRIRVLVEIGKRGSISSKLRGHAFADEAALVAFVEAMDETQFEDWKAKDVALVWDTDEVGTIAGDVVIDT